MRAELERVCRRTGKTIGVCSVCGDITKGPNKKERTAENDYWWGWIELMIAAGYLRLARKSANLLAEWPGGGAVYGGDHPKIIPLAERNHLSGTVYIYLDATRRFLGWLDKQKERDCA